MAIGLLGSQRRVESAARTNTRRAPMRAVATKLKNYRAHPTIEEYVLVDSQSFKIEIYHKENNKWIYEAFENTDEIPLHSLGAHFSLSDAYTDVEFEGTTGEA